MIADLGRAWTQLGDPAFRRVLGRGVALALALLGAGAATLLALLQWLLPETVALPGLGRVGWLDVALGWALAPVLLVLSVLLMGPVASAMTGLWGDEVADAVEARHYPGLPRVRPRPWGEAARDAAGFLAVALGANAGALLLYVALVPLAPVIFVGLNGLLLGREYFWAAALRRESREGARALLGRHRGRVWLAGCLLAVPLLVPVLNLLVPTLASATFTHLYHRLNRG